MCMMHPTTFTKEKSTRKLREVKESKNRRKTKIHKREKLGGKKNKQKTIGDNIARGEESMLASRFYYCFLFILKGSFRRKQDAVNAPFSPHIPIELSSNLHQSRSPYQNSILPHGSFSHSCFSFIVSARSSPPSVPYLAYRLFYTHSLFFFFFFFTRLHLLLSNWLFLTLLSYPFPSPAFPFILFSHPIAPHAWKALGKI
jgi:hypothetical protein